MSKRNDLVAALFVETLGVYFDHPLIEPWDIRKDARNYKGPYPVIAHPPCERWGRYWSGGPSAKQRRLLGDDLGCFDRALWAVRTFGGVLEHPEASHAWKYYGLPKPKREWTKFENGYVTEVEQGNYGHAARKKTWLYLVADKTPPPLNWSNAEGKQRLDEGFHSKEERKLARENGLKPVKRLSTKDNLRTPIEFRDLLISLVRGSDE